MEKIQPALRLLSALAALALPAAVPAKSWQGIQPGQSTRADVVARFGEPSTQGKLGERLRIHPRARLILPWPQSRDRQRGR